MRLKGKKIEGPSSRILVFPRGEDDSIKLEIVAIVDFEPFEKICPEPTPPMVTKPGGVKVPDLNDKNYLKQRNLHGSRRMLWMFVNSLWCPAEHLGDERTPVEWDLVDPLNPETWDKFEPELVNAGFSEIERMMISNAIMEVNSVSEATMKEARDSFLASRQVVRNQSSSQNSEAENTSSGEPANASE